MVLGHNKARARDNARGTIKLLKLSRLAVLLIFLSPEHRQRHSFYDGKYALLSVLEKLSSSPFFCVFVAKESEKAARRKCRKSSGPPVRPRFAI